jgi:Dirigent-like protein
MKKLCVVLVVGLASSLVAAGCGGNDEETETLELVSITNPKTEQNVDVGESGESAGDHFILNEELQQDGEAVGTTHADCTLTGTRQDPTGFCRAALELDQGTLVLEGPFNFEQETVELAIIGGTGDYENASGTATFDVSEQKETPVTVDVIK